MARWIDTTAIKPTRTITTVRSRIRMVNKKMVIYGQTM